MPPPTEYSLNKGVPESQGVNVTSPSGQVLDAPVAELPMRPRVERPSPIGAAAAVEPDRPITSIVKRRPVTASTGSSGQEGSPTGGGQQGHADAGPSREASAGGSHGGGHGKEPPVAGKSPAGDEDENGKERPNGGNGKYSSSRGTANGTAASADPTAGGVLGGLVGGERPWTPRPATQRETWVSPIEEGRRRLAKEQAERDRIAAAQRKETLSQIAAGLASLVPIKEKAEQVAAEQERITTAERQDVLTHIATDLAALAPIKEKTERETAASEAQTESEEVIVTFGELNQRKEAKPRIRAERLEKQPKPRQIGKKRRRMETALRRRQAQIAEATRYQTHIKLPTISAMARELGVSAPYASAIAKRMIDAGLIQLPESDLILIRKPRPASDKVEALLDEAMDNHEEGTPPPVLDPHKVAEDLGVSLSTVYESGKTYPSITLVHERKPRVPVKSNRIRSYVTKLRESGEAQLDPYEIAHTLGTSVGMVRSILIDENIDRLRKQRPSEQKQLAGEYIDRLVAAREDVQIVDAFVVAVDTGVSVSTIGVTAREKNLVVRAEYVRKGPLKENERLRAKTDKEWLSFMATLEPDQVLPMTAKYLVSATLQSTRDFRQESGIKDHKTLTAAVTGTNNPRMKTINSLVDASPIDPQGKAAQDLRVKGEPWSVKQLEDCTFGELLGYIETLKGLTHEGLAEALGVDSNNVNKWLLDQSKPRRLDDEAVQRLLGPQNYLLTHIVVAKSQGAEVYITPEVANKLLLGDYLFAEHLKNLGDYPLSYEDTQILAGANSLRTRLQAEGAENILGKVLAFVRKRNGIAQRTLGGIGGNEQGRFIPQTHKLAEHAIEFGYKLPHPLARLLVDLIEEEKMRKAEQK